mmetsp:Transcript_25097/g.34429  ORF Transcript_25097/g.34429 Transcript_25097/m.34429 type:complete len:91 (+) Transcript_25097:819-1091(+)
MIVCVTEERYGSRKEAARGRDKLIESEVLALDEWKWKNFPRASWKTKKRKNKIRRRLLGSLNALIELLKRMEEGVPGAERTICGLGAEDG